MPELKPCPFCGCEMRFQIGDRNELWGWHKGDKDCPGAVVTEYCRPNDPDDFAAWWNRRDYVERDNSLEVGAVRRILEDLQPVGFSRLDSETCRRVYDAYRTAHIVSGVHRGAITRSEGAVRLDELGTEGGNRR